MKAPEIIASLPPGHRIDPVSGAKRVVREDIVRIDKLLFEHALLGHIIEPELIVIEATPQLSFAVMRDALFWGEPDSRFRGTLSHRTTQWIADRLGLLLPTAKLVDLAFAASIQPRPQTQNPDDFMGGVDAMLKHSQAVDAELMIKGTHPKAINGPCVGKQWVNTVRLAGAPRNAAGALLAANYGWPRVGAKPLQPVGLAHDIAHRDYSQTVWLVGPFCWLDGVQMSLEQVANDPKLCHHVNYDGPVQMRHPGIPRFDASKYVFTLPAASSASSDDAGAGVPFAPATQVSLAHDPTLTVGARLVAWIGARMIHDSQAKAFGDTKMPPMVKVIVDGVQGVRLEGEKTFAVEFAGGTQRFLFEAQARGEGRWRERPYVGRAGDLVHVDGHLGVVLSDDDGALNFVTVTAKGWERIATHAVPSGFVDLQVK